MGQFSTGGPVLKRRGLKVFSSKRSRFWGGSSEIKPGGVKLKRSHDKEMAAGKPTLVEEDPRKIENQENSGNSLGSHLKKTREK